MRVCILNTYETSPKNDIILGRNQNVTIKKKQNTWEEEYTSSSVYFVLFSLNSLQ